MRSAKRRTLVGAGVLLLIAAGPGVPTAAETGVVTGNVTIDGEVAARPPLPVFKHQEVCGDGVIDERLVVGPDGGLRYAVVSIEGVRGGKKVERDVTHVLDNRGCRFIPHVQVAEVGQWLEIENSDPILHNADARLDGETIFNVGLPPGRRVRKPLARAGTIALTCDVRHTWMSAFVHVAEHPYHTVTDAYGAYEIRDLPPGTYALQVWHEELGTQTRPLTIERGKIAVVDVAYAAPTIDEREAAAAPVAPREDAGRGHAHGAVEGAAAADPDAKAAPSHETLPAAAAERAARGAGDGSAAGTLKGVVTSADGGGHGVAGAVVMLDGASPLPTGDAPQAVMDQRGDTFIPHVLAVPAGTTVAFPNHDPRLHNVYSTSPAKVFDLGMYGEGEVKHVTFDTPGVVRVRCNVHPRMEAFVIVHANPYVAVTDADGAYTIPALPAGAYKVRVWHERLAEKTTAVTIHAGQVEHLDLRLK